MARCAGAQGRRIWRSTARASTRRCTSAIRWSPAASCRRTSSSTGSRRRSGYDPARGAQAAGGGRLPQAASMPGEYYCDCSYANLAEVGAQQPRGDRHPREAAADRARRVHQGIRREEISATSSRAAAARSATPRRGWRPSSSRAAPTSMAAIPISTSCSPSRRRRLDRAKRAAILHTHAAAGAREGDLRADLAARASSTAVGPRVGKSALRPDRGLRLHRAVRGPTIRS